MKTSRNSEVERNPRSEPSPALVTAVFLVLLYLVYSLVLRIADYAALVQAEIPRASMFGPPLSLPLILGGELVLGAIAGAVLFAVWRFRVLRFAWLALFGAYLVFLAHEQLAFKHYFSHLDYSLVSETQDVAALSGSIADSMDGFFFVDTALALAFTLLLFLPARPRPIRALASLVARRPRAIAIGSAAYLGLTVALVAVAEQHGLDRPFPVAFAESYVVLTEEENELDQIQLELAQSDEIELPGPDAGDDVGPSTKSSVQNTATRPLNILMYFMESA
ncbi:MAG: hypothetical protein JRF63_10840, partial [Deltaproteobacteria bacterium]|nr:hypothetical protein [Deltaproteobacteria bacterium]